MTKRMTQRDWNRAKAHRARKIRAKEGRRRSRAGDERGWMPALGLGLVWLAASVWLAFMATERFPEFVGPVVRMGSQQTITGPVTHIRDGDTIEVAGVSVRFGSLDCAEIRTTEGRTATATITRLIAEQELTCYLNGRTSYDRKIGSCVLPDGRDLAAEMIRGGYCSRYW